MKRRTKQAVCHACTETTFHTAILNWLCEPVWRCELCLNETPRQTRTSAKRKALNVLVDSLLRVD